MRIRARRIAAVSAVSVLSFTLAACSGSEDEKKSDQAQEQTQGATKEQEKQPEAPAQPLTEAQMQAAVLDVKDLPEGYTAMKATDDDFTYTPNRPECAPIAAFLSGKVAGATMGPSTDFQGPGKKSALSAQVFTFAGKGAEEMVKSVGTALESCTEFTFKDPDGEESTIKVAKSEGVQVGENSQNFTMTLVLAENINMEVHMAVIQQGTGVARLGFTTPDNLGEKVLADITKTAGDKLVKAVQG
jgi:hypothetical protein